MNIIQKFAAATALTTTLTTTLTGCVNDYGQYDNSATNAAVLAGAAGILTGVVIASNTNNNTSYGYPPHRHPPVVVHRPPAPTVCASPWGPQYFPPGSFCPSRW